MESKFPNLFDGLSSLTHILVLRSGDLGIGNPLPSDSKAMEAGKLRDMGSNNFPTTLIRSLNCPSDPGEGRAKEELVPPAMFAFGIDLKLRSNGLEGNGHCPLHKKP